MNAILGLIVTVAMVFGGYLLAGGHMEIIMRALLFEGMMIGGAAIGALLAANDFNTVKHTMGDVVAAFTGAKWKKSDYQDLLCLMSELLNVLRQNPGAIAYLKRRGIDGATAGRYAMGFAPDAWDTILKALGTNETRISQLREATGD